MMALDVREVKDRVGIVDLLQELGVRIYAPFHHGRVSVWCPFCPDETSRRPSGVAYEDTERYHCFQCSYNGDVIDVVQEYLRMDFKEALEWLNETFPG